MQGTFRAAPETAISGAAVIVPQGASGPREVLRCSSRETSYRAPTAGCAIAGLCRGATAVLLAASVLQVEVTQVAGIAGVDVLDEVDNAGPLQTSLSNGGFL